MVFVFLVISLRLMAMSDSVMENYYPERTKGVLEQAQEKGSNQVLCGRIKIRMETILFIIQDKMIWQKFTLCLLKWAFPFDFSMLSIGRSVLQR